MNGPRTFITVVTTAEMAFQTVSAVCLISCWLSFHHVVNVPQISITKLEMAWTTVLMTDMIAFQTASTAVLNPSLVSHKYLITPIIPAIAAATATTVPIIGNAAAISPPIVVSAAIAAACNARNIGDSNPATVTTLPNTTTSSLIGPGSLLTHSATFLKRPTSTSSTGANVSAIAPPTSAITIFKPFWAVVNLSIGSRVLS